MGPGCGMIEPMARIPQRFVGLHAHTGASTYDGMGPPSDHFKWCVENGMDAHAITEHGHMNSFAQALLFNEKWKKEGKKFKYIPGVEAYTHPSLDEWRLHKAAAEAARDDAKEAKKLAKKQAAGVLTTIERVTDGNDETVDIETSNSLTVENEEETKSGKAFNPVNRRHHLVVLPKTSEALLKIFHLVSRGYLEGYYRFPRIDLKMIKEAAKGGDILLSTACLGGILSYATLSQLRYVGFDKLDAAILDDPAVMAKIQAEVGNTFDGYADAVGRHNVLLELQFNRLPAQDVVNRAIMEFARRENLTDQLIVTADSHYPRPELWKHREMYKKLGWMGHEINPDSLPKSKDDLKCELYPKNAQQVWDEYLLAKERNPFYGREKVDDTICDAIERTHDIAHSTIGELTFDKSYRYPTSVIPKGKTAMRVLLELSVAGLKRRGLANKPEYVERLKHELEIIEKLDNAPYFVTLARALDLARKVCLLGVARGSSGGSLVAYVLNITDLDPIKYGCRFDRFCNVHRVGAPDIDVDVADRDKVLEVLRAEFGNNNVVPISNYNTFKIKTLIKDISKFHGISFDEANVATRTVEQEVRKATMKHGDDKNLFVLTYEDAMLYSPSFKAFIDKHPEVADSITVLFKEQRSLGRHAGGVVIMDDAPSAMPLIINKGEAQTPWVEGVGGKSLEPLGYIKYDLLGLETMRLIERSIELILQRREGVVKPTFDQVRAWYETHLHPDSNTYDDPKVYEYVYHQGNFAGVFQLTSQGCQRLFRHAKPSSITDIAVLTSIYRPGPLAAKVDKIYLDARKGIKYDWGHPLFEKVLGKTDNCLIFQEDVMELAEVVGGFPKDQCDNVRRAIMKRDLSKGEAAMKEAKKMEDDFVAGAVKQGVSEATARKSYQQILWFAGYGFNKAHATAYAIDSYMCAWLLTHYEEEWLCAYMESMSNNPEDKGKAFGEIKSMGYRIVPIDVNHATTRWTVLPGKRFMPSLLSCKGVGETAIEEIMEQRPYASIEEMLWNEDGTWRPSKFNKKALENLIKVGAFESLDCVGEGKVFNSYHHMHEVLIENSDAIKKSPKKDPHLGRKIFYELARGLAPEMEEWSRLEQAQMRVDVFGSLDVTALLDPGVMDRLEAKGVKPIDEWDKKDFYWFCIQNAVPKKTKNAKQYLLIEAVGPVGKAYRVNAWGWDGTRKFAPYTVVLAELDKNDFGMSTVFWRIKELT